MSSQNHYTNLCKTLYFNLFCLIKLSRPDQRIVLVHVCVCVYRVQSIHFDGLLEIQYGHYAVEAIPVTQS
jgi:hypothetical protein